MTENHVKLKICSNCGYEFKDANNYCPDCGQKNHDLKVPLKHLFGEVVESTFHLDSKTLRTIKMLIFKPGYLSTEFNAGRRANYVMPVRLYVMVSFIFFFLLGTFSSTHKNEADLKHDVNQNKNKVNLSINYGGISSNELAGFNLAQVDSLMKARGIANTNSNKYIYHQFYKIANSSSAEFLHLLMKNISYMMFILMPVFGLLIFIFNRKSLTYYIEGVIISVHFHSFTFLLSTMFLVFSYALSRELFFFIGILIIPVYMYLMFKNIFEQKIGLTIFKTLIISLLYVSSLCFLMFLTVVISMLLI
jgi:hypothetical protein